MDDVTAYFDQIYQHDDPWQYQKRWYEKRKRDLTLSVLTKACYATALELGCSNGILSEALAKRSDNLLCIDAHPRAVELASSRLKIFEHVRVEQLVLPDQFPRQRYDLIVMSEIGYYLQDFELEQLVAMFQAFLSETGTLVLCHWRYPIQGFHLTGDDVHQLFKDKLTLHHYLSLQDPDFLIDLWTKQPDSLATLEGLR